MCLPLVPADFSRSALGNQQQHLVVECHESMAKMSLGAESTAPLLSLILPSPYLACNPVAGFVWGRWSSSLHAGSPTLMQHHVMWEHGKQAWEPAATSHFWAGSSLQARLCLFSHSLNVQPICTHQVIQSVPDQSPDLPVSGCI